MVSEGVAGLGEGWCGEGFAAVGVVLQSEGGSATSEAPVMERNEASGWSVMAAIA